jgi:hypothetical protein
MNDAPKKTLAARALRRMSYIAEHWQVSQSFRLIKGPKYQELANDDVALIMVGRDVDHLLEEFYEYHRNLGVSHMLYVDNNSKDNSLDVARAIDGLVVVATSADFAIQQGVIRRVATQKYFSGGWRLLLDADEIFDYPGSEQVDLSGLVRHLMLQGHTGLVAQMLDMVPTRRLSEARAQTLGDARQKHIGYHLDGITSYPYHSAVNQGSWYLRRNTLSNRNIEIMYGGIRNLVFGESCMLTKHPLIRDSKGVVPMPHPHISTGLNCANFTGLILHYKFSGDPFSRDKAHLDQGLRSPEVSEEIRLRLAAYEQVHDLDFGISGLRTSPTIRELIDRKFLILDNTSRKALGI